MIIKAWNWTTYGLSIILQNDETEAIDLTVADFYVGDEQVSVSGRLILKPREEIGLTVHYGRTEDREYQLRIDLPNKSRRIFRIAAGSGVSLEAERK